VETGVRPSGSRKAAAYRVCEAAVTLEESSYRDIVVHSDASDKRRQKKLDRVLTESREKALGILKEAGKVEYYCRADAEAAAANLRSDKSLYHFANAQVAEKVTYSRGRPRRTESARYRRPGTSLKERWPSAQIRSLISGRRRDASFFLPTPTPPERWPTHQKMCLQPIRSSTG